MTYHLSLKERELMTPGPCLRCGCQVNFPHARNSAGRCVDCHNLEYLEYRAKRKQMLAAMPRCNACNRRGTFTALSIYLCGYHLRIVEGKLAGRMGIFSLVAQITAQDILTVLSEAA